MAKEAEIGLMEILRQEEMKVNTAEEASTTWKRVVLRFEFFSRSLLYVVRDNGTRIVYNFTNWSPMHEAFLYDPF